METLFNNPWLQIPASEYEGHMDSPAVRQGEFLNRFFADTLAEFKPPAVLVCGCTTGNGLEHIDPDITKRVVGFDINPEYIRIAGDRHSGRLPFLKLYCTDVEKFALGHHGFDLIVASLFFEYVSPVRVLPKLAQWLRPDGKLAVILQLPSPGNEPVTPTHFKSLRLLTAYMQLIPTDLFKNICGCASLACTMETEQTLPTGKAFYCAYFKHDDGTGS